MKSLQKIFLVYLSTIQLLYGGYNNQDEEYVFKQLRVKDGLSQSTIVKIIQDKEGFMWFATSNGLNKFDGYQFTVYTNNIHDPASISDNGITSLYEDSKGYIWVGTIEGVLNRFNRKTGRFKRFFITESSLKRPDNDADFYEYPIVFSRNDNKTITSIAEDSDGIFWIGTWGNGIIRFDRRTGEQINYFRNRESSSGLISNRITKILIDSDGIIWVGTFGGGLQKIKILDDGKATFLPFDINTEDEFSLMDNKVITLYEDKEGTIWIGTYFGGISKLTRKQKLLPVNEARFINYKKIENTSNCLCNNTVMAILQDHNGYMWFGTFGGGLDRFDPFAEKFVHYTKDPTNENSLADNDVLSLWEDKSGILWIGTHLGEGISKLEPNIIKFNLIQNIPSNTNSLNDDVVWSVSEDEDSVLWIGTYRGGLNRWDRRSNKFSFYLNDPDRASSLSDNHIRSIEYGDPNHLWIGTYNGGLAWFNKNTGKAVTFKHNPDVHGSIGGNQVQDIFLDSDSVLWLGVFGGGLNKLNLKNFKSKNQYNFVHFIHNPDDPESISDNRVYKIFKDREGALWIGTFGGGLNRFDPKTAKFEHFFNDSDNPNSLSDDRVMSVLEDRSGYLWIGTYGGGLNKFDRDSESFISFGEEEGLMSGAVYGILEDNNGNLWMSTDAGIFKFDINSENFTQFGVQDGLQSMEFSGGAYYKSGAGELFFGGIKGLNYFYPDSIKKNSFIPPVVITSIKVLNKPLRGERDEIILDHNENFLSFEFAALDYSNPFNNQYMYKMEGIDPTWHLANANFRVANYTNLPPGDYIFKVRGTNNDGLWSSSIAQVKISILPPFWLTWWFIAVIVLLISYLIYYLSTVRIKNQLAIEKLKTKLAADLHDNIGSGLTEISILSEVAAKNSNKLSGSPSKELTSISDTARKLVDSMSDIVWMVNPKRDSLYDLILRLKDSYKELMFSLGISFKTNDLEKLRNIRLPMDYRQNLFLIFKEAINNALKHSNCSKLILKANVRKDVIEMVLEDDGVGFEENEVQLGNGLRNLQSRANLIGGKLKWKSVPGKGTTLRFIGRIGIAGKLISLVKGEIRD